MNPIASYYAFGAQADRLIQIEVTSEPSLAVPGTFATSIRAIVRRRTLNTWATLTDSGYQGPANPADPIQVTVGADTATNSFAVCSLESGEWDDDNYDCWPKIQLLGLSEAFGDDLDWKPGSRKATAKAVSTAVFDLKRNGELVSKDTVRSSWTFQMDLNRVFSASARKRYFITLRVSGANQGRVTVANVQSPLSFASLVV